MNHWTSKEVIRDGVIAGMFFSLSMVSPNGAAITLEELAAKVDFNDIVHGRRYCDHSLGRNNALLDLLERGELSYTTV